VGSRAPGPRLAVQGRCQSNDNSVASNIVHPMPSLDYAASPFHSAKAAMRLCL
jgi:hypothetical protein